MSTSNLEIKEANITVTRYSDHSNINNLVKTFLYNKNNTNKIIGLSTEQAKMEGKQRKTVLLQFCDGDHCLIIQLPLEDKIDLPVSLFNFLNLPDFTFVGIGMNKISMFLETDCGFTCKNAVEIGASTWDLNNNKTDDEKLIKIRKLVSSPRPTSAVFDSYNSFIVNKNQTKLAASNAYFAFRMGNILLG